MQDDAPVADPKPPQASRPLETPHVSGARFHETLDCFDDPPARGLVQPLEIATRGSCSGASVSETEFPLDLFRRIDPAGLMVREAFLESLQLVGARFFVFLGRRE